MPIRYALEPDLSVEEFIDVLRRTSLGERRPLDDRRTMEGMLRGAQVIVTARDDGGRLVGVARSITDFHYCLYLADLAVDEAIQRQGVGRELMRRTHEAAGKHTMLILLAAPKAKSYYPHVGPSIGMKQHDSCWVIDRQPRQPAPVRSPSPS